MAASAINRGQIALQGALAGAAGGVLLAAVLITAGFRGLRISPLELGLLYIAACLAWGMGYASLAATQPQINRYPALSGFAFGTVVYVVTQIVLYGIAAEQTHTVQQVAFGLGATCVFFGLPVAFVSRALVRAR